MYCVLDIIEFNSKNYVLFSVEGDKLEYLFYEIISNNNGYNLNLVNDDLIKYNLMNIIEGGKNE
jgi:hypothetical protein